MSPKRQANKDARQVAYEYRQAKKAAKYQAKRGQPTASFYIVYAIRDSDCRVVSCPESWDTAVVDKDRMIDLGYVSGIDPIRL